MKESSVDKCQLSVIVPIYNARQYLRECLESIVAAVRGFAAEIICVDDGSTDESAVICRDYPVRLIVCEHRGAGVARNTGLAVAVGKYVHFVDADDTVVVGAYSDFLKLADKNELDMVRGNGISRDWRYRHMTVSPKVSRTPVVFEDCSLEILKLSVVPWLGIVRRSFIMEKSISFASTICGNDVTFFYDLLINGARMQLLRRPLVRHFSRPGSLIQQRHIYFTCDFENYNHVLLSSACLTPATRKIFLRVLLINLCNRLLSYKKSNVSNWNAIQGYAKEFFRSPDLSLREGINIGGIVKEVSNRAVKPFLYQNVRDKINSFWNILQNCFL